ncbi:protein-associating with the carboxyl-terminal domain of ezrin [Lucilia sericata]|uniref:protein-associating with the carboxyl-terminal domain of ezrin n=1 Tax=Lucilia sericata TaxID=13632 RepID=UPI0018A86625|nr:protein-associating with the carboxyl-terminal domain of ezrin [Lucilia sericata]
MGNEGSKLKGLEIDKNAVEANDFWALFNSVAATTTNEEGKQYLSVFQGEPVVTGQLWVAQGPMERAIRNLMIYRHPYILKYVCTWEQGGQKHLATERVRPLQNVLSQQSDIQVCLGLRTILCSLIFLIEKAMARHLNICTQSIYITDSGSWRLAGFEYVWKQKEVTKTLLDYANAYRYQAAVDPEESKELNIETIEQYAFANLCEEILTKCTNNRKQTISSAPIPHVQEFREYCATHLKHKNAQMRPKLSAVLLHPYFNHEFVLIHSFLFELPLKSNQEKQEFFTALIDRLRYFEEEVVGSQFAGDLLSRMVLLDPTAQLCVTPYVLRTKTDHSSALFSSPTYCKYLMPHILKMFRLRDAQIRLILLEYFMEFVRLLTKEELEENILPYLVTGMQDTNDVLVAKTLRCMADLIPILGATTVLGGQRTRLFSDGRPQAAVSDTNTHWVEPRSITPVLGESNDCPMVSGSPIPENLLSKSNSYSSLSQAINSEIFEHHMPPRLSPDGGEDVKCTAIQDSNDNDEDEDKSPDENKIMENQDFIKKELVPEDNSIVISDTDNNVADVEENMDDDDDAWSDWDNNDDNNVENTTVNNEFMAKTNTLTDDLRDKLSYPTTNNITNTLPSQISLTDSYRTAQSTNSSSHSSLKPSALITVNDDLSCLDIQVQTTTSASLTNPESSEFDFFKDMEPVIETSSKQQKLNEITTNTVNWLEPENIVVNSARFAATAVNDNELDVNVLGDDNGWQVDDDDVDISKLDDLLKTSSITSASNNV